MKRKRIGRKAKGAEIDGIAPITGRIYTHEHVKKGKRCIFGLSLIKDVEDADLK